MNTLLLMNTKLNHIIDINQVWSYVNDLSLSDFWLEKYQMQDNACYTYNTVEHGE